jgi:hypothetical protein
MPLANQLHVDKLLSNVSVAYRNNEYVAQDIAPSIPVMKDSDLYRTYTRNFRIPETLRASKGVAKEHEFEVGNSSYILEEHALKSYVGDEEADNYDISDLRADTTEELTDAILRMREKKVLDLFTTTNWSLNVSLAAANAFNANTTVSNPIPVFDTGASTVISNSGKKPNWAMMNREAVVACKNHLSVLDRVKYTSSEISENMLAALFGVSKLYVPLASLDSSSLGGTESIANILGDVAFLGFNPGNPGPKQAASLYTFEKNLPRVRRWRDEERKAEAIEVQMKFQAKVVASLTGYLIKDVI